jgi:WS/DGAT/MGAT family acyltransferase
MVEQLSPMEAIMWRVGQDPMLRMTVGTVMILDHAPEQAALIERLAQLADDAPRLHRRPDDSTPIRPRPIWLDDGHTIDEGCVRSLAVAHPGTMRQVLDLVGLLETVPFDPTRSPWDVTLIDGLEDGKAALYLRAHHVLTDGMGGIRLLGHLVDEPTWPHVAAPTEPAPPAAASGAVTEPETAPPATPPVGSTNGDGPSGTLTLTIDLPSTARRVADGVAVGVNAARDIHPVDSTIRVLQRALDVANSVSRQLMVTGGALSQRPQRGSLLSRFEAFSIERARDAALALGGSRHDLLVAATAAGLGRYYDEIGQHAPELRLATPTSQQRSQEPGGNWFAPARVEIPTSAGPGPKLGPQFGIVAERLAQARREPALQMASRLAATAGRLPTRMLLPALHAQAESVDFAATAVPGLRGARHICGARIERSYPMGPRLGCPMNITAFGNDGRLDIGLALDPQHFDDPDRLVGCLSDAFADYLAAAGVPGSAPPKADRPANRSTASTHRRERSSAQTG